MTGSPDAAWVGIDIGTQSVRALAVARDGVVLGSGAQPLSSHRDGNRHEQDPEQWWTAAADACRQATAGLPPQAVRGVAVDATSGSVLLIDDAGRALTPALMYDDGRASTVLDVVNDTGADVWATLGYGRMQPSWALPKLIWLIRAYPGIVRGARLAHQSDFVNRRLVGHDVASDLSNALKTGADLIKQTWPQDVLDRLGVPPHLMPGLTLSGTQLGTVSGPAAAATGLPVGTPVISGMTDGCAAQIGAGALREGDWNSVLGTTLILKGVTPHLLHDPSAAVYSHRAPDGDWLPGGASSTGAGIIARDYAGQDLPDLNRRAVRHEPSSVLAYPLAGRGERFPFVAPRAEAFLLGRPESSADRYAAVLQGVAYIERLCIDYLDHLGASVDGSWVITGGATRNTYWNQVRADVLGRPVSLPENAEPALGMAVLAASIGRKVRDVAAEMVRIREIVEPRADTSQRYNDPYLRFVDELEGRGWLAPASAAHARERTTR